MNHATCPPEAHDRSLPDPLEDQAQAEDGLLACNDCGRPAYYCTRDDSFQHTDPDAVCFLIRPAVDIDRWLRCVLPPTSDEEMKERLLRTWKELSES